MIWLRFGLLFLLFIKAVTLFGSLRQRFKGDILVAGPGGFAASVSRGKNRRLESACLGLDLNDKFGAIGATAMTKAANLDKIPQAGTLFTFRVMD